MVQIDGTISEVIPSSGPAFGGTQVTIFGQNLGSGSDVTSVSLAGINATIVSQNSTQIIVVSEPSTGNSAGDVKVYSTLRGVTTLANGFTYTGMSC